MQCPDGFSEAAKIACQAFNDMRDSKDAHFKLLQALEAKYESGGAPGAEETEELARLLARHDKNVLAFKTALAAVTDENERDTLLRLMS